MTKIRNTKKGMAKKTLSISLAVAMLATSNVPVWAAEDLFTDGEVAVEAFTADEVVEEAPVVEDVVEAPEAKVKGDAWAITIKDMPKEAAWGEEASINVEVKDIDEKNPIATTTLKYVWKNAEGLSVTDASAVSGVKLPSSVASRENVGKDYTLFIYDENGDFEYTSAPVTIGARDISELYKITVENRAYNGVSTKQDAKVEAVGTPGENDKDVKFDIDYTGDLVNVGTVSVSATPLDTKLYKGEVAATFDITKADITKELATASLLTTEAVYTGKTITLGKADVAVVDKNTGDSLDSLVTEVITTAKSVDSKEYAATVKVEVADDTNKNFAKDSVADLTTTNKLKVVARDLGGVNVVIESKAKKENGAAYTAADFSKDDVTFTDAEGNDLDLMGDVDVVVPKDVKDFGTYTFEIKPKANNKNVTGSTTATFSIFSEDISGATFKASYATAAEHFTGSQITKDVEKLGSVWLSGKEMDPADYRIEFGTNVNAGVGKGVIYIIGQRTYEGSKAVCNFTITQATVTKADLEAAASVVYNKDAKEAADYAKDINLVVKAKNGATPAQEFTLTEGTDYTVAYKWGANAPYSKVTATVTLKNTNYKESGALTKDVVISNTLINDADIHMKKDSYEYTGTVIVPEFDVIVDGKTLVKDTDYEIVAIEDSAKVGTATVTIKGKGASYDKNNTAKATFQVTPVSAEKVEVKVNGAYTYTGEAHKPTEKNITVTLNGNNVASQFEITAYGENINAGKEAGTFTVAPKKDNKNFTAGTTKTVAFDIAQAPLAGEIKVYNEKGIEYKGELPAFEYDGTEKTFAKAVFVPSASSVKAPMKLTDDDYEIKYVNNVTGGGTKGASIVVIAKGNYTAKGTVTDNASGTPVEIKNVVVEKNFAIDSKLYFTEKEVTVTDAEYAGENVLVKPVIVVRDGDKVLKEGTDYTVVLKDANKEVTGITAIPFEKDYTWEVKGAGVYKYVADAREKNYASGTWKIIKKDVANLEITAELNSKGEPVVTVKNGGVKVDLANFDIKLSEDKKTVTVSAKAGNRYYVGAAEVATDATDVGSAVIEDVVVDGNRATVVLSGDVSNAVGYDYVIATEEDYKNGRVDITKNQLKTTGDFFYVQKGVYYAYCHAWKRDENGQKVFGEWSNLFRFTVSATTPGTPVITKVTRKGNDVTVTYTASEDATGYDVVLGTTHKVVNGERRPLDYGTLVKKNLKAGTTSVTFKNVPAGTYYAGLHAFNRTRVDNKKVFSPWSNIKTIVVK